MSSTERDHSWQRQVNPTNTPWVPGYRFSVAQLAQKHTASRQTRRRFQVCFEITEIGELRHTGGPRPTQYTLDAVMDLYERGRPK